MKKLDKETVALCDSMNALMKKCGIPVGMKLAANWNATVGCHWCDMSEHFNVWLPRSAGAVIAKVLVGFSRAGFTTEESGCENVGAPGFIQITAEP